MIRRTCGLQAIVVMVLIYAFVAVGVNLLRLRNHVEILKIKLYVVPILQIVVELVNNVIKLAVLVGKLIV
jgi:hypothetical protein